MRMKKMTRILAVCMMAILLVGTTMGVHAQSVTETEPNDTMETAELISPNRQTPQEFLKANNSNTYVVKGSVSDSNEDWFKIYLDDTKDSYFSIYSGLLYFRLYDANGIPVTEEIYETEAASKYHVYDFNYLSTGYYYICLRGSSKVDSYQFLFGNPIYRAASIMREGRKISLSSSSGKQSDVIKFDVEEYPGAQVYNLQVGALSSYASKVEVKYEGSSNTITKTSSVAWGDIDIPLSYNYGLSQNYTFTYTYKNVKTFTPTYDFYYVYPILP